MYITCFGNLVFLVSEHLHVQLVARMKSNPNTNPTCIVSDLMDILMLKGLNLIMKTTAQVC